MNTKGRMSYKDFIFPVNPSVIRITHKRKVAEQKIPYSYSKVFDLGEQSRIISGEGEFFGTDYISDFERLKKIFQSGGGGMLYLPSQKPIYAVFESLELLGQDIDGVIQYSFRFVESFDQKKESLVKVCISDGRKSLWDYSYRYGIDIETLVRINTDILRPDIPIRPGKKVKLC